MSTQRYSRPAMLLHWAQAILIVWLLWLGWTMVDLPKGPERISAYNLHKSLGLCAFLLVLCRLAWRFYCPPPPSQLSKRAALLAELAHRTIYGMLLAVPLAGYLLSSFTSYSIKFFGIELPKTGWPDEALNGTFKLLHFAGGWALTALIVLHVAAALHHLFRRDGTMQRMLPGR